MPPRRNDPLGVSDDPIVVTDPERDTELIEEFLRRLDYIAKGCLRRRFPHAGISDIIKRARAR